MMEVKRSWGWGGGGRSGHGGCDKRKNRGKGEERGKKGTCGQKLRHTLKHTWHHHLPRPKKNIMFLGEKNCIHAFLKYEDQTESNIEIRTNSKFEF